MLSLLILFTTAFATASGAGCSTHEQTMNGFVFAVLSYFSVFALVSRLQLILARQLPPAATPPTSVPRALR